MSYSRTMLVVASCLLATVLAVQPARAVPRDIVLALDNSGSMRKNDPEFLTAVAVKAFIRELRGDVRLAILIFDQRVRLAVPLTRLDASTRGRFLKSLRLVDFKGLLTNSPAALERAIYELKMHGRSDAQKSIVFMTDGIVDIGNKARDRDKTHWMEHGLAAEAAQAGIRIFGIAFTEQADFQLIQSLAQRTDGDYFRATHASEIQGVFEHINHELETSAAPAPPPPPPANTESVPAPPPAMTPKATGTLAAPAPQPPPALPPEPSAGTVAAGIATGSMAPPPTPPPTTAAGTSQPAEPAATPPSVAPAPGPLTSAETPPSVAPQAQGGASAPPAAGETNSTPPASGASAAATPPTAFVPPAELPPVSAETPPGPAAPPPVSAEAPPASAASPPPTGHSNEAPAAPPASGGTETKPVPAATAPVTAHGGLLGLPWSWVAAGGGGLLAALLAGTFLVLCVRRRRRRAPEPSAPRAYLNDLSGATTRPSYELTDKLTVVGRLQGAEPEKTNYIVIDEATIGRRHAMIEYKDHSFWVIDQSSLNGTFVNNKRIDQETRLKHGDRVRFHKREFEFVMLDMFETDRTMVSETMFAGVLGDTEPEMEDDEATQMRERRSGDRATSSTEH